MERLSQQLENRPGFAFALTGGGFACLYALVGPVDEFGAFFVGERTFLFAPLLIIASSVSALLVGTLLWNRFAGEVPTSSYRPAVIGALVGMLSMPVTMYVVTVSRHLFTGLPDTLVVGSPPPGVTQWTPVEDLILQDISIALFTSLFGFVFTAGLPIVIGAATGEALRRLTANDGTVPAGE